MSDVSIPGSFDAFYRSEFPRMVNLAYALSGSRLAAHLLIVVRSSGGTSDTATCLLKTA